WREFRSPRGRWRSTGRIFGRITASKTRSCRSLGRIDAPVFVGAALRRDIGRFAQSKSSGHKAPPTPKLLQPVENLLLRRGVLFVRKDAALVQIVELQHVGGKFIDCR